MDKGCLESSSGGFIRGKETTGKGGTEEAVSAYIRRNFETDKREALTDWTVLGCVIRYLLGTLVLK